MATLDAHDRLFERIESLEDAVARYDADIESMKDLSQRLEDAGADHADDVAVIKAQLKSLALAHRTDKRIEELGSMVARKWLHDGTPLALLTGQETDLLLAWHSVASVKLEEQRPAP